MAEQTTASEGQQALEALAALNDQRAATYRMLSRMYRVEADQEMIDTLSGLRFPAATGNESADAGYRLIARYLSNRWPNTLTDLAIDYARCFIGDGMDAYAAAYPYESVYTSEKRLMMQDARDEVLAIYRSAGLDKQASWRDGEDHIALELEFMGAMASRTAEALRGGDEDGACELLGLQRTFLADHVASWVPMMTCDLRKYAKTDLYQGLALLTDGFVALDGEFLGEVLDEGEGDASASVNEA